MLTDGKPAIQLAAMRRSGKYPIRESMQFFAGAFHKVKELYVLTGKHYSDILLNALLHAIGRITEGQRKWVLNPGDSNDCAKLFRELYYALLVYICRECIKARAKEGIGTEPSPEELEAFMLERASKCPAAYGCVDEGRTLDVWMRSHSTDVTELKRLLTKDQLNLEIMQLKQLAPGCMSGEAKSSMNKDALVEILSRSRSKYQAEVLALPMRPVAKSSADAPDELPAGQSLNMSHWLMQNLLSGSK